MKFQLVFLAVALLIAAVNAHNTGHPHDHPHASVNATTVGDNSFDFLLFTQGWPGTTCSIKSCDQAQLSAAAKGFLIHGLWPNNNDGSFPSFCTAESFDPSAVEDLLPQMNYYWPSLYESPSSGFWDHEWTKHGTCCTPPTFANQHGFFLGVLSMRKKIDVWSVLQAAGVSPSSSQTYRLGDLTSSLNAQFGVDPVYECYRSNDQLLLSETWFCVGKDLQLMQCPTEFVRSQLSRSKCGSFDDASVLLPPVSSEAQRLRVQKN